MKTLLNEKEITYIENGRMVMAIKEFRERKASSLREAHDACAEVREAIDEGEPIDHYTTEPGMISPCRCDGDAKITSRRKRNKIYVQVRCNRCGRRGAVYHYFNSYKGLIEIPEEVEWPEKDKAEKQAVRDWTMLISF